MLEKATGMNCQASNFLKVFSSLSETATMGLLEEFTHNSPTAMIQATNRYLIRSFAESFRHGPEMEQALTTAGVMSIRCGHCSNEMLKPGATMVHDLIYPAKRTRPTFTQILKSSVERQEQSRGWCDRCKRYQQLNTRKTIQAIPKVLMINTAVHSLDQRQIWATPNFLPREIGIIVSGGQFYCYEGQDLQLHLQRGVYAITVYDLVGYVADIHSEDQSSHLVSMIDGMCLRS